jgi:hypothetical protein
LHIAAGHRKNGRDYETAMDSKKRTKKAVRFFRHSPALRFGGGFDGLP